MRLKSIAGPAGEARARSPAGTRRRGHRDDTERLPVSFDGVLAPREHDVDRHGSPTPVAPGSGLALTRRHGPHDDPALRGRLRRQRRAAPGGRERDPDQGLDRACRAGDAQGVQVIPLETSRARRPRSAAAPTVGDADRRHGGDPRHRLDRRQRAGRLPAGGRRHAATAAGRSRRRSVAPLGSVFICSTLGTRSGPARLPAGQREGRDTEIDHGRAAGAFETVPVDAAAPPTPTVTKRRS